ncbi:tyrosine-protein phosphatase [Gayadomonas joobiniege]|uniref:tyrosine-protein phosphatase n=1 Tax=Gayadomonas joobiniege TaxID=1234606 RepID=UPI000370D700|nr:tyrosine-protein phosphatase [Gayadomonas joobiniege]
MKLYNKTLVLTLSATLMMTACQTLESQKLAAQNASDQQISDASKQKVLQLEGGRNFRQLGGYEAADGRKVKWDLLYRSGALHKLTPADYQQLAMRDIATVIDFRANDERAKDVTQWQADPIKHMTWDYQLEFDKAAFGRLLSKPNVSEADMEQLMIQMYPDLVHSQKAHYKAMFARLLETDKPVLFHCTAGKDRTGIAAALILTSLGVDKKTVIKDYVMSEQLLDPAEMLHASDEQKADPMYAAFARLPKPALKALMGTRASYLEAAFAEMERQSGSVENYIQTELEVSPAQIVQLRAKYLK